MALYRSEHDKTKRWQKADRAWDKALGPSRRSQDRVPYTTTVPVAIAAWDHEINEKDEEEDS